MILVAVTSEPSGAVDVETLVRKSGVEMVTRVPIVTTTEVGLESVVLGCTMTVLVESEFWIPLPPGTDETGESLKSDVAVVE